MGITIRVLTENEVQYLGEALEHPQIKIKTVAINAAVAAFVSTMIKKIADYVIKTPEKKTVISVEVDRGKPEFKQDNNVINIEEVASTDSPTFLDEIKKQLLIILQEAENLKSQVETTEKRATNVEKQVELHPNDMGLQQKAANLRRKADELKQALKLKEAIILGYNSIIKQPQPEETQ